MSNSPKGNKWRFQTLPSEPDKFDPETSIFRSKGGGGWYNREYNCILCGHISDRFYTYCTMEQHCKDPIHCALVKDQLNAHSTVKSGLLACHIRHDVMFPRIEKLGLPAWQDRVRADLCSYFASAGKDSAAFTRAVNHLFKYEHMERISLLELAAWKASCILDTEESKKIHDMLEWVHRGWKQNKTKMRRSTATNVIVENVLRFIEGPRKMTKDQESLAMFTPSL